MPATVKDVIALLESWAPLEFAEEWDNCGFQVGDPFQEVKKVVVALDITGPLLEFARGAGADLVVTHHPAIFSPLRKIDLSTPHTRLLAGFLRYGISIISMHTNLDAALGGVNDILAKRLGLDDTRPLLPNPGSGDDGVGLGRIGVLKGPTDAGQFLKNVSHLLDNPSLFYAGPLDIEVHAVGLCGGSGSSLFEAALDAGVDAFVTGEVKHSIARLAEEAGVLVVDAGHFHTEYPVVSELAAFLEGQGEGLGFQVEIFGAERPPLRPFGAFGNG